jgi:hypothetical protein
VANNGQQSKKQAGATKAQLEHRAKMLGGTAGAQVAAYNAERFKAERDERAAKRIRKSWRVL